MWKRLILIAITFNLACLALPQQPYRGRALNESYGQARPGETRSGTSALTRRLAIDIGTSSIKVKIGDVAPSRKRVERMVYQNTYRIPIRQEIESSGTRELSKKIKGEIRDIVAQNIRLARSLGAEEVAIVATVALENAKNVGALTSEVEKGSGASITFIDQDQAAAIGFDGAASVSFEDPSRLVVWDIGGETSEITTLSPRGSYIRFETQIASATFADLVSSEVKRENPQVVPTPNPLSKEQIDKAVQLAKAQTEGVPTPLKAKIAQNRVSVIGIGAIPFLALNERGPTHSIGEIRDSLYALAGLKDNQIMSAYPNHAVTNLALALGTMEALGIQEVTLEVVDLTTGLLLLPQYLQPLAQ